MLKMHFSEHVYIYFLYAMNLFNLMQQAKGISVNDFGPNFHDSVWLAYVMFCNIWSLLDLVQHQLDSIPCSV